jgi:peptidoglycan/xylan/chitin deacetylase (PgdA/CDA1 family)
MNRRPSALYRNLPEHAAAILRDHLEEGLKSREQATQVRVFFRADDIGVVSQPYTDLMSLFYRHQMPLCLAVVPAWLTQSRWSAMNELCDLSSPLWCWHQHGWQHHNHQTTGKKCEFGSDRLPASIQNDIVRGKTRLESLLGPQFTPFFTPPWNRCSPETLNQLHRAGFRGLSRDNGTKHAHHPQLPDFAVNVDLHTRREPEGHLGLAMLASELRSAAETGQIGFMIHHQRMNSNSFHLLEGLLGMINSNPALRPVHFSDLL